MIFLVVLLHCGLVYENTAFSAMFWIAWDPATNGLAGILRVFLDIFVMAVIFFISGYLAPQSFRSKSTFGFIKTKFKRLMVPWLLAVLILIPVYKFIFLYSRNLPQQEWNTYFHWSNEVWSQNWLWFLPVLFLFDLIFVVVKKSNLNIKKLNFRRAVMIFFRQQFCIV